MNCMHGIFPQSTLACALSGFAAIEPVRGAVLSHFVIAHADHEPHPAKLSCSQRRRLNSCSPSACREPPSSLANSKVFHLSCTRQLARITSQRASVSRASQKAATAAIAAIAASFSRPTLSERALRPASSTSKPAPDSAHTNHLHSYFSLRPRHVLLFPPHLNPETRLLLR